MHEEQNKKNIMKCCSFANILTNYNYIINHMQTFNVYPVACSCFFGVMIQHKRIKLSILILMRLITYYIYESKKINFVSIDFTHGNTIR